MKLKINRPEKEQAAINMTCGGEKWGNMFKVAWKQRLETEVAIRLEGWSQVRQWRLAKERSTW